MLPRQEHRPTRSSGLDISTPRHSSFTWPDYMGEPCYPELPNDIAVFLEKLNQTAATQVSQTTHPSENLVHQILTTYDNLMQKKPYKAHAVVRPLITLPWSDRTIFEKDLNQSLGWLPSFSKEVFNKIFSEHTARFLAIATRPGLHGNRYPSSQDMYHCIAIAAFPLLNAKQYFERMLAFSFGEEISQYSIVPPNVSDETVPGPSSSSTTESLFGDLSQSTLNSRTEPMSSLGSNLAESSADPTMAAAYRLASFHSKKLTRSQNVTHLHRLVALSLHALAQKMSKPQMAIEKLFIIVEHTLRLQPPRYASLSMPIDWELTLHYLKWQSSDILLQFLRRDNHEQLNIKLLAYFNSQLYNTEFSVLAKDQNLSAQLALAINTKSSALVETLIQTGANPYLALQYVVNTPLPMYKSGSNFAANFNFSLEDEKAVTAQLTQLHRRWPTLNLNMRGPDEFGFTLLHHAISGNNIPAIRWLLERGADPNVTDNQGNNALIHFVKQIYVISRSMIKSLKTSYPDYGLAASPRHRFIANTVQTIFRMLMSNPTPIDLLTSNVEGDTAFSSLQIKTKSPNWVLQLICEFGNELIEKTLESYRHRVQEGDVDGNIARLLLNFVGQGYPQYAGIVQGEFQSKIQTYRQGVWELLVAIPGVLTTIYPDGETLLTAAVKAKCFDVVIITHLIKAKTSAEHWPVISEFFDIYTALKTQASKPTMPDSSVLGLLIENYLHLGAQTLNSPFNQDPMALQLLAELYAATITQYPETNKGLLLTQLQEKLGRYVNLPLYLFREATRLSAGSKHPNTLIDTFHNHLNMVKKNASTLEIDGSTLYTTELDELILQTAIITAAKSANLSLDRTQQSNETSMSGGCRTTSWDGMPMDGTPFSSSNPNIAPPNTLAAKALVPPAKTADEEMFEQLFNNKEELARDELLDAFIDPITQTYMTDPVITPAGHTYERYILLTWLTNRQTDPLNPSMPVFAAQLIPNRALKLLMDKYKTQKLNEYRKQQDVVQNGTVQSAPGVNAPLVDSSIAATSTSNASPIGSSRHFLLPPITPVTASHTGNNSDDNLIVPG